MKQSGVNTTVPTLKSPKKKTQPQGLRNEDYVHLHTHTHYSVLDGLTKIPSLVERVVALGMRAVAITDHGTLSGIIEFYQTCKAAGVKPIIGIEAYVAKRRHTDKEPQVDKQIYHLTLLAMNTTGYNNLMRLSSISHIDGFYYKPRIDRELLQQYSEGVIVLSGCIGSEMGDALRNGQDNHAREIANWYLSVFGNRYYLEVQDHGHQWSVQDSVNRKLLQLGKDLGIPVVVTGDSHYATPFDQEAHELLLCIQTGAYYSDSDRMSLKDMDLFIEDPQVIINRWSDYPEVIKNTRAVAERCALEIELGNMLIPRYPLMKGETEQSLLTLQVWRGLAWRYGGVKEQASKQMGLTAAKKVLNQTLIRRAEYELKTINKMGFDSYFLIVSDFVQWGKEQGIVFGPGRGSAAGSIVSYALKITDIDPLEYDLLFERFLNPDRISMPDIDIDIQDNRRDEVIKYVADKYGHDRVANIVTFGKMAARNAIRDVARVLEIPYADADRLAKKVPPPQQGRHIPLADLINDDVDLRIEYGTNPTSKRIINRAIQLEGTIRSHGVHAAGVVIAPNEIVGYAPLEVAQKGVVATQYAMGPIESIGLLKMDFLGLSNLTIIKNALRIIKKVYQKEIDISSIALSDVKTYDLLSRGETTGVFQLESSGMKRYLKELKPTEFDDIIAMCALYRPGPLKAGLVDAFVRRKNGLEKVNVPHKKFENALSTTYGTLVYQEQVMQISQEVCGFSGGEADTLRKAIGKKIRDVMIKMKEKFIDGGVNHGGVPRPIMEKFWDDLLGFADYAFNKSHSACYALIAYQTAYLKAHYPDAFMAALMTNNYDDTDKLAVDIAECRAMSIEVVSPDVNESFMEFAVVPNQNKIRFGLLAVKNVGSGPVEEILRARDDGGRFQSIEDFARRVDARIVNKKALESLIKSGAFDTLEITRDDLLANLDLIISYSAKLHKERDNGQSDLFSTSKEHTELIAPLHLEPAELSTTDRERLQWERELLGIYLSSHPLLHYRKMLEELSVRISKLRPEQEGATVQVGGMVSAIREITTKNAKHMAFITIEGLDGSLELVVFPKAYESVRDSIVTDSVILASGTLSNKDRFGSATNDLKLLIETIRIIPVTEAETYQSKNQQEMINSSPAPASGQTNKLSKASDTLTKLYVKVADPDDHETLLKLKQTFNKYPGANEAILVLGDKNKSALRLPFRVDIGNGLTDALRSVVPNEDVVVK